LPISKQALAGIKAAAEWNPHGARILLSILKEFPSWVKIKLDDYGPLSLILYGTDHRQDLLPGVTIPVKSGRFPDEFVPAFKTFGSEWRKHQISAAELAYALEVYLKRKE
jgi:hypothetical protein